MDILQRPFWFLTTGSTYSRGLPAEHSPSIPTCFEDDDALALLCGNRQNAGVDQRSSCSPEHRVLTLPRLDTARPQNGH